MNNKTAKKILVVDDDRGLVALLKNKLKANGYRVIVSFDGKSALDKVEKEAPDLIILDIMMPKVNGFTVCSVLKSNETYKSIPLIMLTARQGENDREFSEETRPNAYLNKPLKLKMLLGIIRQLINKEETILN